MIRDNFPARYLNSDEFAEFQDALDDPVALLKKNYADFKAQLHLATATWGLEAWEKALGLNTDVSKSDTYRRECCLAKLRSGGVTTAAMIEDVAASFSGGEVEVTEEPAAYGVKIKFVGQLGTPAHLSDVTAAVNAIIPAHLAFYYAYTYLLISDIEGLMTLAELETQTLDKFAGGS